jgi:hypothetical protein
VARARARAGAEMMRFPMFNVSDSDAARSSERSARPPERRGFVKGADGISDSDDSPHGRAGTVGCQRNGHREGSQRCESMLSEIQDWFSKCQD